MKFNNKNLLILLIIIISALSIFLYDNTSMVNGLNGRPQKLYFSDFINYVEEGKVKTAIIQNNSIRGKLSDDSTYQASAIIYDSLLEKLHENKVSFNVVTGDSPANFLLNLLISWSPMAVFIVIWIMFMRQMQAGGNKTMSFGKSRARLITLTGDNVVTFDNVAGIEEAKNELKIIVEFLKNPSKFTSLGGKIPKGCLLVGPPGSGKTLLAKAIACEAGKMEFFYIAGTDFVEMFVGVGASRVRDTFDQAKKHSPCLLFIDEIDAIGRRRNTSFGGGNDEKDHTLNQLLVEMDGFESKAGVIVLAATNLPDVLDPALLRPGRFDRQITVSLPDVGGREKILLVHMKHAKIGPDVDTKIIAKTTPGFSGADLANLVNEAALYAASNEKKLITMDDFEHARDKVMMGVERKSMIMTDEEKNITAYHESGHAIMAIYTPGSDPIHKATIIPRGRSLGLVMRLPETDRTSLTKQKLIADIAVAMGGRVAEEIIFGHDKITSGASSDIKQATRIARMMVTEWGMSAVVGPLYHDQKEEKISDDMANLIDEEVRKIVDAGYKQAQLMLTEKIELLHLLAGKLREFETLSGEEIRNLLNGKEVVRSSPAKAEKKSTLASKEDDQEETRH